MAKDANQSIREAQLILRAQRSAGATEPQRPTTSDEFLDSLETVLEAALEEERGDFDTTPGTLLAAALIAGESKVGITGE